MFPNTSYSHSTPASIGTARRIAIAPGDPAGIGYEITVQALERCAETLRNHIVIVYAQHALWDRAIQMFAPGMRTKRILTADQAAEPGILYLIDPDLFFELDAFRPGQIQAQCANCAHRAIARIISDVRSLQIDGICTGPIHKGAMRLAGVQDIGHTEMLANGFEVANPMTLFITKELRIFFYTRHLSLRQAIDALNEDAIVDFAVLMHGHMQQLGFDHPRLAMAALNPHAGDSGQFGTEEREILIPAAQRIRRKHIDITDPIGADSVFAQAAKGQFDAVLSLYHDQGHIAAKTYDFERTISATLGLPCLRTSVDHGTAMDIAWQGLAQSISMQTAIETLLRYL